MQMVFCILDLFFQYDINMGIKIHIMSNCVQLVQLINKVPMFVLIIYELIICYTLCVSLLINFKASPYPKQKNHSILFMKILEEQ
jgi:hypothetical protein